MQRRHARSMLWSIPNIICSMVNFLLITSISQMNNGAQMALHCIRPMLMLHESDSSAPEMTSICPLIRPLHRHALCFRHYSQPAQCRQHAKCVKSRSAKCAKSVNAKCVQLTSSAKCVKKINAKCVKQTRSAICENVSRKM